MLRLLLIGALAATLAGCGGGGDRLSKEEFVRQNETCQEFERKITALGEPENLGAVEGFADESAEIARDGREKLRDLEPPEDLAESYDRLVETLDEAILAIERIGEAAADGDESEVQRIAEESEQKDADSDRIARELGLDDCAED